MCICRELSKAIQLNGTRDRQALSIGRGLELHLNTMFIGTTINIINNSLQARFAKRTAGPRTCYVLLIQPIQMEEIMASTDPACDLRMGRSLGVPTRSKREKFKQTATRAMPIGFEAGFYGPLMRSHIVLLTSHPRVPTAEVTSHLPGRVNISV
ncbi:unnamed protein product [Pieris brassicae]|uniref:Uncharacterized protein n=1 Tax=Pieris brassicae TaxID=7116 RepID=A0A9P0TRQ3_PIEBR|nr:unnamed protein product [Pieris brassicae]